MTRAVAALAIGAAWLANAATVACLALVCAAVAARYVFGAPFGWADKVGGWLVVALVLLAAGETQRRGEHIGVDVAVDRLGPRWAQGARLIGALSVATVAAVLLVAGWETVAFSRMVGMMTDIEGVPEWWVQSLLPVGAAILLLVALAQVVGVVRGEAGASPPRPTHE